jgi:formylglycine-generating enzyme required for sulfatase activity
MASNVWEWNSSAYRPYPYNSTDGRERADSAEDRVLRGGSWFRTVESARAALRDSYGPADFGGTDGFRLVCTAPGS